MAPPNGDRCSAWSSSGGAVGYTVWRDLGEFRRPMLYLAVLAVAVGDLAQLHLPADPRGPVPRHQRGRAHHLAAHWSRCSTGCSTASRRCSCGRPTSSPSSGTTGSTSAGSSPATGATGRGVATTLFSLLGTERRGGPVAAGPAGLLGLADPDGDAHAAADLLPQLQVRLLLRRRSGQGRGRARGARAGLLLRALVRGLRTVDRGGLRRADAARSAEAFSARGTMASRWLAALRRCWCWPSFRCSATMSPRAGPTRRWPATSRTTCWSRWSRTAS